ncbi:hypothetical protein [Nostoc sp.]
MLDYETCFIGTALAEEVNHPIDAWNSCTSVDYLLGGLLLKAYNAGKSENTIDYLRYLLDQSPNQGLLLFWDGASYPTMG